MISCVRGLRDATTAPITSPRPKVMKVSHGFTCLDTSPAGPSVAPAADSWRGGVSEASPSVAGGRRAADALLFEVTDASIVRDGASKYVVSRSVS